MGPESQYQLHMAQRREFIDKKLSSNFDFPNNSTLGLTNREQHPKFLESTVMISGTMWHLVRRPCPHSIALRSHQVRAVSNSPYGRTHVWKRRPPVLPNPIVPKFPQRVIRSDGTSFTHWTTSPRSTIRLTRDTTNNPIWNTGVWSDDHAVEEEGATTGRLGRFHRKFEELGLDVADVTWMENVVESTGISSEGTVWNDPPTKKKKTGK